MNRLALFFAASIAFAQNAREIVEEVQRRARSESQQYEGVLQVISSKNRITEKRWQFYRIGSAGNSKTILRFTAPPEVKGVALLVVNHPDRSSDQWMWTPALARDRRIAFQDRSTRFFGTDFTFEDLEERDVNQFEYKLLGEEAIEGTPCWQIESKATAKKSSQYARSIVWVRKDIYAAARIDLYIKDAVVRRIRYGNYQKVQNIWSPLELEMTDLRRKSRTILKTAKLQYNVPLKEESFTVNGLRREL